MSAPPTSRHNDLDSIQEGFEQAIPRMRRVIRFRLRHLGEEQKEEETAEALALAWKAYRDLWERGADPGPLINKIAEYSARRVNSGVRLIGKQPVEDVASRTCRHRHGYSVEAIPLSEDEDCNPGLLEALQDRKARSPVEEAALRVDYDAWLDRLTPRQREMASQLAGGMNTVEVAKRQGFSRMRLFEHRKKMRQEWDDLHGEDEGRER